jgi:hypothetical protein
MSPHRPRDPGSHAPTNAIEILALVNDQVELLAAISAGRLRDPDLDREYWMRARTLHLALRPYGFAEPFGFPTLAAWVAECRLRHPDPDTSRQRLDELAAPVRKLLSEAAA